MEKKTDRRAEQTELALREALAALLREKTLGGITVGELTDKAGVNRTTFYLHYADVPAFCRAAEDALLERVRGVLENTAREDRFAVSVLTSLLSVLAETRALAAALLRPGSGSRFPARLYEATKEPCRRLAARCRRFDDAKTAEAHAAFLFWGYAGLTAEWLEGGAATPAEEMARMLGEFSINGTVLRKFREFG